MSNFKTFKTNMVFLISQIQVYIIPNIAVIHSQVDDFSLAVEHSVATGYTK